MNKEIISEISRIHQLMGTSLIIEADVVGGFKSIADEILTYVSKKAGKFSDNVIDLVRKLKNATSEDEIIKLIAKLINTNDELANIYIPKIMALIPDNEAKQIIELKTAMREQLQLGVPVDNVRKAAKNYIDKSVITPIDGIKDIYKKELDDYLTSITKPPTPPTPPKPKPKTVTDVVGQTFDDVTPLTSKDLTALEKMYRQKGLGGSFFKAMRQFSKKVKDMMSSSVTLMDETLSLIKEFSETTNSATKVDLGRRIGDNLNTLTQKELVNKQIIDEWIDTNVFDYKIKNKIKDLDGYKKAANLYDSTALKEWQQNYVSWSKRRSNLRKQLNSLLNPFSWFGENIAKWEGSSKSAKVFNKWKSILNIGEEGGKFSELRQWARYGQTQKWSGIKDYAEKFGWPKALLNVSKEMLFSYILLSAGLAFVDYVTDLTGNLVRNVPYINDIDAIQQQIKSWDEHMSGDEKTSEYPIEGFWLTVKNQAKYLGDEFSHFKNQFPGFYDELDRFLYLINTSEISKESVEKITEEGEKVKKKLQQEKTKIENDSLNDKPIPAPDNNDTIVTPEKIKAADELGL